MVLDTDVFQDTVGLLASQFSGLHFAADGKGWKPNVNIRALTDNFNIISSFPDRYISLTNFTPLLFSHDQAVK